MSPASGLVSILKKRSVGIEDASVVASSEPPATKTPLKRRVRFKVPDDGYDHGQFMCFCLFLFSYVNIIKKII